MGGEETKLRRFVLAFVMSDDCTCRSYNSGNSEDVSVFLKAKCICVHD